MKLILADDHGLVRDALVELIRAEDPGAEIHTAGSFDEASACLAGHPDAELVLLDMYMPGMVGVSGAVAMRRAHPDIKVALLSGSASPVEVLRAMDAGLDGFLPKSMRGASLVALLRLLATGVRYFPPEFVEVARPRSEGLTEREMQVVSQLRLGATNKMIARRLGLEEMVVKGALRSAGHKLGARTRTEIALKALSLTETQRPQA